ncbi:hypothetical protein GGG16DRAFT_119929 [Schizophyllum commune]
MTFALRPRPSSATRAKFGHRTECPARSSAASSPRVSCPFPPPSRFSAAPPPLSPLPSSIPRFLYSSPPFITLIAAPNNPQHVQDASPATPRLDARAREQLLATARTTHQCAIAAHVDAQERLSVSPPLPAMPYATRTAEKDPPCALLHPLHPLPP